jgi:hypothetical protein
MPLIKESRWLETQATGYVQTLQGFTFVCSRSAPPAPQTRTSRLFDDAGDHRVYCRAQRQEKGLGEMLQAIYRMMGNKIRRQLATVAGKGNNSAVIVSNSTLLLYRAIFWSGPTWRIDASSLPPQSNCSPNLKPLPSEGLPRKCQF